MKTGEILVADLFNCKINEIANWLFNHFEFHFFPFVNFLLLLYSSFSFG